MYASTLYMQYWVLRLQTFGVHVIWSSLFIGLLDVYHMNEVQVRKRSCSTKLMNWWKLNLMSNHVNALSTDQTLLCSVIKVFGKRKISLSPAGGHSISSALCRETDWILTLCFPILSPIWWMESFYMSNSDIYCFSVFSSVMGCGYSNSHPSSHY